MRGWLRVMAVALAVLASPVAVPAVAWADGPSTLLPETLAAAPLTAIPLAGVSVTGEVADHHAGPGLLPEAEFILAKTATYEIGTSLVEAGIFVAFFGGGLATAGSTFGIVLASTAMVYLVHEIAWEAWLPAQAARDDTDLIATKTVTYRVLDTLRAFTIGSALGGAQWIGSVAYTATLTVAELALYAANEVVFARLRPWFIPAE